MLNNINQMILNPRTSPKEVAHVISNDSVADLQGAPRRQLLLLRLPQPDHHRHPRDRHPRLQHDQVDRPVVDDLRRLPPQREAGRLRPHPVLEALDRLRLRGEGDRAPPELPDAGGALHRRPAPRRGQDRHGPVHAGEVRRGPQRRPYARLPDRRGGDGGPRRHPRRRRRLALREVEPLQGAHRDHPLPPQPGARRRAHANSPRSSTSPTS